LLIDFAFHKIKTYRIDKLEDNDFEIEMSVRDYECDIQGVVNNSVYQNYLEHARHEYLKSIGIDFKEYADKGINLTVTRAELDYKYPLTSGDKFVVTIKLQKESKVRFAFYQDILLMPDRKIAIKGKTIGVVLNAKGRPYIPEEFEQIIKNITIPSTRTL
jgi:acyl-CoA thioester hydrolase